MSRNFYEFTHPKEGPLEIVGGWDRPLAYGFLTVHGPDGAIFSNLDRRDPDITPEEATQILADLGIPVPEGFIEALEADRRNRPGNQLRQFTLP